ncbi:hypothetical protein B0H10DRAFT_1993785 [Mycena sp. CBHHK59/15]|nr:hypothetical protein B0H10DRAFT_1993785 [Mycena sp. CBHHK59/15]
MQAPTALRPPPIEPGLIHSPSTPSSVEVLQKLLHKDYLTHHCFFTDAGFHNHLPHHLVAAHDMGAPPELLRLIYADEASVLRPLNREGDDITDENWTTRLGEHKAYASYLAFFSDQISKEGVEETFRKYVLVPEANGNNALMLGRFLAGALHPFLQVGFGVEFGQDYMVAQGLAMAAITSPRATAPILDMPAGLPVISDSTSKGATLLSLLREVYQSEILKPVMPYDPDALLTERFNKLVEDERRAAEIKRIYTQWLIDTTLTGRASDAEFASKADECLWQATLLLAATSKPNRAPRLDFFLMHVLTSALCIPSLFKIIPDPVHKAQLLQGYVRSSALFVLLRGRPRIDIPLLMSYSQFPLPPLPAPKPELADALGDPRVEGESNPWLAVVQNALHHKDAHVIKAVRTLYYCAQHYGLTAPGAAIGARDGAGEETHAGAGKMDGTVFIRAAGVLSEALGWVAHGGKPGNWDRSALGWDAAWDNED